MCNRLVNIKKILIFLGFVIIALLQGCASLSEEKPSTTTELPSIYEPPVTDSTTTNYHTVQAGETLYAICQIYGCRYKEIANLNGIASPYIIHAGQRLLISGTNPYATTQPVTTTPVQTSTPTYDNTPTYSATGERYTVQPGDTLYRISKLYGYRVEEIAAWNGLYPPYALSVGQTLLISPPPSGNSTTAPVTGFVPVNTSPTHVTTLPAPANTTPSGQHVVQAGDTLYSVAKLYGYGVEDIAAWNALEPPYTLSSGQVLVVSPPSSASLVPTPTYNVVGGEANYHAVAPGDTLYRIAKQYGYTVAEVAAWNALSPPYQLSVGQKVQISPTTLVSQSVRSTPYHSSLSNPVHHTVKRGETLWSIATQYGMSNFELANLNGIGSPYTVYPGQRLIVTPR